ncbi:MAG: hypothetical protein ACTHU0_28675 [Kofleriaceae bacterium]
MTGETIQHLVGHSGNDTNDSDPAPVLPNNTYRMEQQSNEYMPPDNPFMGVGFWTGGNLLAPVLPDPMLQQSVDTLSAPSNDDAPRNRMITSMVPGVVGSAIRLHPGLRALGGIGQVLSGFLGGTEHRARVQSDNTPRLPPNPNVHTDREQLSEDYRELSNQYEESGYSSQSRVTRMLDPNSTNAQVSNSIHERLLQPQGYESPFTRQERD